jgi:hypothetical protein
MIFFMENEEGEVDKAICGGSVATSEYVRVVDTGNGIDIFVDNAIRATLNYAEMSRVEACLRMLEASGKSELLGYWKVYEGKKI